MGNELMNLINLLNHVSIIVKKNNELLDATGGRFNVFNIIGLASDEVKLHSALLAELLNPKGTHGLKDEFLKEFIKQLCLENFDSQSAKVNVEKTIGLVRDTDGGRIDIILWDKNGTAIIIENKIYAGDQKAQLIRYDNYGKQQFNGNHSILYLTLDGKEASKDSVGDVRYIPVSYAVDILNWIEKCLAISVNQPLVRETINQYITLIKQLTNQDMNTLNKEDVVNTILSTPANLEAAFSIISNSRALEDRIIIDIFNNQLLEVANELHINIIGSLKREKYAGFHFKIPGWRFFNIGFEFDQKNYTFTNLIFYLTLIDNQTPAPQKTIDELKKSFRKHNPNYTIPCGYDNLDKFLYCDINTLKAIVNGEIKKEIKNIVEKLIIQGNNLEM